MTAKTVDIPTTIHSEARKRNFLHSWVQRRETREWGWWKAAHRGEGELHCHISGLPSCPRPHPHCPTPASGSDKEDTAPVWVPPRWRTARGPGLTPVEPRRVWSFHRSYRRTTSDSSSWYHGHILEKQLSRPPILMIEGSFVLWSFGEHWNRWWDWAITSRQIQSYIPASLWSQHFRKPINT